MATTTVAKAQTPLFEGVTPYHWMVFGGCWLGGIFDGLDSTLYSVVQKDAVASVSGETARAAVSLIASHILSTFLFGWVLGGIIFGIIGDKFGRVRAMVISILIYALFTGLAGLAQDPTQLAVCRFLTGMGIGGELVTIATMLSETWPERSRALAVGSVITSYQVGVLLAGLLQEWVNHQFADTGIPGWRIVFWLGAAPAVLSVFIQLKLEEPDKWKEDKAQRKDEKVSAAHAFDHFKAIFKREHAKNLIVGGGAFGGLLVGYWASLMWIPTWIQDLLGANAMGDEHGIATRFHGAAAVLGCITAGIMAIKLGRRWTIILAYIGSFAVSALMFLSNKEFSTAIYWQDAMLGFFIGISQAIMYIYLPELFPTRIRATAVGFCLNIGRLVTAFAVLFVGTMVEVLGGYAQALLVFSLSYLVAVIAGMLGRETRDQGALPD